MLPLALRLVSGVLPPWALDMGVPLPVVDEPASALGRLLGGLLCETLLLGCGGGHLGLGLFWLF